MIETQIISNCGQDQNHCSHESMRVDEMHQSWHSNLNKVIKR